MVFSLLSTPSLLRFRILVRFDLKFVIVAEIGGWKPVGLVVPSSLSTLDLFGFRIRSEGQCGIGVWGAKKA